MIVNDSYPYISLVASISGGTLIVTSISGGLLNTSPYLSVETSMAIGTLGSSAFGSSEFGAGGSVEVLSLTPSMTQLGSMLGGADVPANVFVSTQLSGSVIGGVGAYALVRCVNGVVSSLSGSISVASENMLAAPWTLNCEETIISQYANSPILLTLINNMNAYVDASANLFNFYNQIWNINSATGYGLDIWGRIVGVKRNVNMPLSAIVTQSIFYFAETGVNTPFAPGGSAPFYGGAAVNTVYRLSDDVYRSLILVKALANISNCSAQAYNQLVCNLFGAYSCYTSELGNMAMQLTFTNISVFDYYLIINAGVLSRPAGVLIYCYRSYAKGAVFSFAESGFGTPFGNGGAYVSATPFVNGNYAAITV
jgi:hypothetical protein